MGFSIKADTILVRTGKRKSPIPLRIVGRLRDKRRIAVDESKMIAHATMASFSGYLIPPRVRQIDNAEEIIVKFSADVSEDKSLNLERDILLELSGLAGIPSMIGHGEAKVSYLGYDHRNRLKNIRRKTPYFVMSKIWGENLVDLTPRRWKERPPGRKEAAFLMTRVFPALAERLAGLHDKKVVHRDVKPANAIYSRKQNLLTLLDFGRANWVNAPNARTQLGTFGYFPPELIVREPKREDVRTDVYALGITCFAILTGEEGILYGNMGNAWEQLEESDKFSERIRIMEKYYRDLSRFNKLSPEELVKRSNMPAELKQTELGKYLGKLFHPARLKRPYYMRKIAENLRKFGGELAELEIWS